MGAASSTRRCPTSAHPHLQSLLCSSFSCWGSYPSPRATSRANASRPSAVCSACKANAAWSERRAAGFGGSASNGAGFRLAVRTHAVHLVLVRADQKPVALGDLGLQLLDRVFLELGDL